MKVNPVTPIREYMANTDSAAVNNASTSYITTETPNTSIIPGTLSSLGNEACHVVEVLRNRYEKEEADLSQVYINSRTDADIYVYLMRNYLHSL